MVLRTFNFWGFCDPYRESPYYYQEMETSTTTEGGVFIPFFELEIIPECDQQISQTFFALRYNFVSLMLH